jgi:hypothetical protein
MSLSHEPTRLRPGAATASGTSYGRLTTDVGEIPVAESTLSPTWTSSLRPSSIDRGETPIASYSCTRDRRRRKRPTGTTTVPQSNMRTSAISPTTSRAVPTQSVSLRTVSTRPHIANTDPLAMELVGLSSCRRSVAVTGTG